MRKIILTLAVSLDNYIEGPEGETDWLTFSPETGKALQEYLQEVDTILYGRASYETWGTYIPADDAPPFEKDFYNSLHAMKKYVFTTSGGAFKGNPTVVRERVAEQVHKLKQSPGKHIWLYGGAGLISTFMDLKLIDEIRLAVHPVVLGKGKPLFGDLLTKVPLKLLETRSHKSGVVALSYRPLFK